jgi:hypothetical protein
MNNYFCEFLKANGLRDCFIAITCNEDHAAIDRALSLFRMAQTDASRVLVWRDDALIFDVGLTATPRTARPISGERHSPPCAPDETAA